MIYDTWVKVIIYHLFIHMKFFLFSLLVLLSFPVSVHAVTGFLGSQGVWMSEGKTFAGDTVKLYTVVVNNSAPRLSLTVEFYNGSTFIKSVAVPNLTFEEAKQVWVEYTLPAGEQQFSAKLTQLDARDQVGNSVDANITQTEQQSQTYDVDLDTDGDDIGNKQDTDDDNDGLADTKESEIGSDPLKKDTDGDGLDDKIEVDKGLSPTSTDTDGDGHNDNVDLFPTNKSEWADIDKDGTGDNADTDDDNDGLSDSDEAIFGSDPHNVDSDGDGLTDGEEKEKGSSPTSKDTDADGILDKDEIENGTKQTVMRMV